MGEPELGDVILSDHTLYNHYGIYVGNNSVIHYYKDENNSLNGIIKETDMNDFLNGGKLYTCQFTEKVIYKLGTIFQIMNLINSPFWVALKVPLPFPAKVGTFVVGNIAKGIYDFFSNESEVKRSAITIYDAEETVNRARSKIGTGDYNLFSHNCEHFAIWCKTGLHESEQVKKALQIIIPFYN